MAYRVANAKLDAVVMILDGVVCFTVVLEQMESIFEHTKSFKRGHGASRR